MEIRKIFIYVLLTVFLTAGIFSGETEQAPLNEGEKSLQELVPEEGLICYLRFEEKEGNDIGDMSGEAVGVLEKASRKEGKYGNAVEFTQESAIIRTKIMIDQDEGNTGATFCAFVLPYEHEGAERRQAISTDNSGFDWSVLIEEGKWFVFNNADIVDTGIDALIGQWQFICAVFDPEKGITFYINDEAFHLEEIEYDNSTNNLAIGNNPSNDMYPECFLGMIDEVLVYDRPLSGEEVAEIYNIYRKM